MPNKNKVISLFSGAGGLDLGFIMSSKYEILLANDIKEYMVNTYSLNFKMKKTKKILNTFPQVVQSDVNKLDFSALKELNIDIIIGGPPCQDFSVLRASTTKRQGITVRRGRLYAHFVRALVVLQPKAFVFENVPGLVSANKGLAYKTIINDFLNLNIRWKEIRQAIDVRNNNRKICGYYLIFNKIVNSSMFGVPQNRRRLIILGIRKDLVSKSSLFELPIYFRKALTGGLKLIQKYPLTSLETFEGKTLLELQEPYEEIMRKYEGVWREVGTQKAIEWKNKVWDKLTFDVIKDYLFFNKIRPEDDSEIEDAFKEHEKILKEIGFYGVNVNELKLPDKSNEIPKEPHNVINKVKMIPPGENFQFVVGSRWELRRKGVSQIYRKLNPLTPSYTVVAYGGGGMAMYHYDRNRSALTYREKARLQSFPDSFRFTGSNSAIKAEIGEAVPPLMAKRIAIALAHILEILD
ncbi:MAG: DNA cytosine methyltransferase [Thermoproteales archaeon]|nr:DNA cytosine methyltransferase [Thermoproteales archaeon]